MTNQPPYPEPQGYSCSMGFVKNNPKNNDFYVEQWKDDPWYPAIKNAAESLERTIPGYNISQIKEKFGGLRFYVDQFPEGMDDRTREQARRIVTYAEGWVDGFEAARKAN